MLNRWFSHPEALLHVLTSYCQFLPVRDHNDCIFQPAVKRLGIPRCSYSQSTLTFVCFFFLQSQCWQCSQVLKESLVTRKYFQLLPLFLERLPLRGHFILLKRQGIPQRCPIYLGHVIYLFLKVAYPCKHVRFMCFDVST